jgi:hypothetical protein
VTAGTSQRAQIDYNNSSDPHVYTVSLTGSETNVIGAMAQFITGLPGVENWAAGIWDITINVTTANANVDWVGLYICRSSSGCVNQSTVGSSTFTTTLSATGLIFKSITCAASNRVGGSGDLPTYLLAFTNNAAKAQSFGFDLSAIPTFNTPLKPRRLVM